MMRDRSADRLRPSLALAALLVVLLPLGASAQTWTLSSGDKLVVSFATHPPFMLGETAVQPEYLELQLNRTNVAGVEFTTRLYDADVLLGGWSGFATGSLVHSGLFKDLSSSSSTFYDVYGPTPAGFGSILDGTIDGRLEMEVTGGTMEVTYGSSPTDITLALFRVEGGSFIAPLEWTSIDVAAELATLDVQIDIRPGDPLNRLNLLSAGVIPVAILSSGSFDALTVDPGTVTLAGAAVKVAGQSDRYLVRHQDVNGDGLLDLVCHVYGQLAVVPGTALAVLEGTTLNGRPIRGEDTITIVR